MYRRSYYKKGASISDMLDALREQNSSVAYLYFEYNDGEMCIEGEIERTIMLDENLKPKLYWHLTVPIADIDRQYKYVDDLLDEWVFAGRTFNNIDQKYLSITWN